MSLHGKGQAGVDKQFSPGCLSHTELRRMNFALLDKPITISDDEEENSTLSTTHSAPDTSEQYCVTSPEIISIISDTASSPGSTILSFTTSDIEEDSDFISITSPEIITITLSDTSLSPGDMIQSPIANDSDETLNVAKLSITSDTTLCPDDTILSATRGDESSDSFDIEKLVENSFVTSTKYFDKTLSLADFIMQNPPTDDTTIRGKADKIPRKESYLKQNQVQKELVVKPSSLLSLNVNQPSTSSLRKSPGKRNAFKHVISPVASYIYNIASNRADNNTKKTTSSIPKPVRSTPIMPSNNKM